MFLAVAALSASAARAAVVNSNDVGGQDGFVYAYSKVPAAVSNGFDVIPAGQAPVSGDSHSTEAYVQFGLGSIGLTGAQVTSATLSLYLEDATTVGFGVNPSAGQPITVDVYPVSAAWDRNTIKWSNKPANGALITSSTPITGIGAWVNFDVTSTVANWLDNPGTNFGFVLKGSVPVGASPDWVYANFSSGFGELGNAPMLTVVPVPEPGSIVLVIFGLPLLGWQARRRWSRRAQA
jgi:hypothetical protein